MANTLLNTTDRPSALRNVQYVSAKEVFDAAKQGDELAAEIVDRHGKCLGKALAQIACVVDPEVFVIGGGVSKAGTIITDTTEKYFKEYAFHACKNTKFTLATLGNDAGMYGWSLCDYERLVMPNRENDEGKQFSLVFFYIFTH